MLMDTFFHCLSLLHGFLQNQTHTAKIFFWLLEKQDPTIDSIYGLLLLSKAPQDSIDTTVLSVYFPFYNITTSKLSYSKKDITLSPINKSFYFFYPTVTTPTPYVTKTLKHFICFEKD